MWRRALMRKVANSLGSLLYSVSAKFEEILIDQNNEVFKSLNPLMRILAGKQTTMSCHGIYDL